MDLNRFLLSLFVVVTAVAAQITCEDICGAGSICCGPHLECCGMQPCCGNYCCGAGYQCVSNTTYPAFCCDGTICGDDCFYAPCTCNGGNIECPHPTYGCNGNGKCMSCYNGCTCSGCTCFEDNVNGHWAGPACQRCADWYYSVSTGCNTPTPYKWTFAENFTGDVPGFPMVSVSGSYMLINPAPQIYQLQGTTWNVVATLEEDDLTLSGMGAISGQTIFQLASNSTSCFGVFYEGSGGEWKETAEVPLNNNIPGPCDVIFSFNMISVALNNGIAAVMYVEIPTNFGFLEILSNTDGTWAKAATFKIGSGDQFYSPSNMVAIGDGLVAVIVMTQDEESEVYVYGMKDSTWTLISTLNFNDQIQEVSLTNDNILFLGFVNITANNQPYGYVYTTDDNGYNWTRQAHLALDYPSIYGVWTATFFAAADDGNSYCMVANPTSTAAVIVYIFQNVEGKWILSSSTIVNNAEIASAGATGSNFIIGITESSNNGIISYLVQESNQ